MPRIDEMPEYRAKLPKNVHDLSHPLGFTSTIAHLLPVFHDFLNPGETVQLGFNYKLRTQPLQSAAMVNLKTHVEYFFVPIQMLYEPFGNMYYDINDYYSSFMQIQPVAATVQTVLPVWDYSAIHTALQSDMTTMVGYEEWFNHVFRLFDLCGFNPTDIHLPLTSTSANHNPNVFPYQFLAYQCIYQYYYRLDNRERFDNFFNWDKYYNTPLVSANSAYWQQILRLRYRPKDSDYFTDIKVSPIVDALNLNDKASLDVAKDWLTRGSFTDFNSISRSVLKSGDVGSDAGNSNGAVSPLNTSVNPSSSIQTNFGFTNRNISVNSVAPPNGMDINTANIRAMFATEKLWSITGRARKHYDDQTLAHFGFKVPHDPKHEISCFGHDRGNIQIGEVISTASTSDAPLGEIAGKGYGVLDSPLHKFTAPCHGVVMAIFSVVPEIKYSNTIGKFNVMTSKNDLYQPEYDHLGMQPLFKYESQPANILNWGDIVGWQYRYEQWKRRYGRVTQAFRYNVGNLDSWMLDYAAPNGTNTANYNLNFIQFLHDPSKLNQIMLVNYRYLTPDFNDGEVESSIYDGDPFVVDGYVSCKKISTMSDYSLPRLDA